MKTSFGGELLLVGMLCAGCRNAQSGTGIESATTRIESVWSPPATAPSALASNIIATLPLYPTNISVTVVSNAVSASGGTGVVETVIVRPPPGMRDGFMYTIVIDHQARQYWVERSGGIAGRRERRGPISCEGLPLLPPAKGE